MELSFSTWSELLLGVPQGSVLGPLLFNIYLNDLLWFMEMGKVCNYADDTTLYDCNKNLNVLTDNLEKDSAIAIEWFGWNYMILNTDQCKLIVAGHKDHKVKIKVGNSIIEESEEVNLLGVIIDSKLTFREYLYNKIKKANSKLAVIKRNRNYLSFEQKKIVLSSFVHSQFSYAPLAWMFYSRELNNKINRVHRRALRILYEDEEGGFEELLEQDGGYTVHERNIQTLMIEMFKAKNKMQPFLLQDIFEESHYTGPTLRRSKYFSRPNVNTVKYGEKSLQNLGTRLWDQLPGEIQNIESIEKFKIYVKTWRPIRCPCTLCKTFIRDLGYVTIYEC